MTLKELEDYGMAIRETPVPPSLDLEEFFAKRAWESKHSLSKRQELILQQGQRFINLAIKGRAIGISAVNEGKLGVDLPAISAYLFSYQAYQQSSELRKFSLDKILKSTSSVLETILADAETAGDIIPQGNLDLVHLFFLSLSRVPVKSQE